jgi:hypothetical protein
MGHELLIHGDFRKRIVIGPFDAGLCSDRLKSHFNSDSVDGMSYIITEFSCFELRLIVQSRAVLHISSQVVRERSLLSQFRLTKREFCVWVRLCLNYFERR